MAEIRVNPTRMELKKLQGRYTTARRGHKLLKDKRDELMRQFLDVVREDKELRKRVEKALETYYRGFSVAGAASSQYMLEEALLVPAKEGELKVSFRNLMSVTVPVFDMQVTGGGGGMPYGLAFTSGELDVSLQELNGILEDLLRMAELEKNSGAVGRGNRKDPSSCERIGVYHDAPLFGGNEEHQDEAG